MPWLMLFLARLGLGEQWRKATSADWRYGAGYFFLIPVYFLLFVGVGGHILHTGGTVTIWLFVTAAGVALVFGSFYWAKLVPTKISWLLAAIAWPAFMWWSWHHL